jgi:hypothetical protein
MLDTLVNRYSPDDTKLPPVNYLSLSWSYIVATRLFCEPITRLTAGDGHYGNHVAMNKHDGAGPLKGDDVSRPSNSPASKTGIVKKR